MTGRAGEQYARNIDGLDSCGVNESKLSKLIAQYLSDAHLNQNSSEASSICAGKLRDEIIRLRATGASYAVILDQLEEEQSIRVNRTALGQYIFDREQKEFENKDLVIDQQRYLWLDAMYF